MAKKRKKRAVKKKKKSVIPVALISLIAGSLITLSIIYKPSWIKPDNLPDIREVFQIVETAPPPDTITIEVWNGAGVSDLATRAQNFLETRNGDVMFYAPGPARNAGNMNYLTTIVISHDSSFAAAQKVAEVIGIGDSSIVMMLPALGQTSAVDVTVILGRDRDDSAYFIPYRD